MSRIGRKPIVIPTGVNIDIVDNFVKVNGPKGELSRQIRAEMQIERVGDELVVTRPNDNKLNRSLHGLSRTLIANMVDGVTKGFTKTLIIEGVGYRAAKAGNNLNLTLGFSHPLIVEPPQGVTVEVPEQRKIVISGINKENVGAFAAKVRGYREPEPYKGKGVRYENEVVRRKAGKAGAKGKK